MKNPAPDKKQHILNAAEQLFAQNGYDSTSAREIAETAEVNAAMIAYYFGSKENLLKAIIERYGEQALALLRDEYDAGLPPDDRLKKLTSAYLEYAFSRPGPIVIAHREVGIRLRPDMHESIQAIFTEIRDMIQTCINEGVASGIFRNVNLPLFMFVVAGMYDHIVNQLHVLANLNIDGSVYGLPGTDTLQARRQIEEILWDLTESYLKKH